MDQMHNELTNGDLDIELENLPVPCDCTKFWLDNDAVLSAGLRAAEKLTIDGRICLVNSHTDDCDGLCEGPFLRDPSS